MSLIIAPENPTKCGTNERNARFPNDELHEIFKNDIYYKGTVVEKIEKLLKMERNSAEYEALYQDIISVG